MSMLSIAAIMGRFILRKAERTRRTIWRRMVVGFAALALILQGLNLFSPSARLSPVEAALAFLSDLPGAATAGTILCLNVDGQDFAGKAPAHNHDSGSCPMCQIVGFSLAGAPEQGQLVTPAQVLSDVPAIRARQSAPRAPPHFASSPRGPPALV